MGNSNNTTKLPRMHQTHIMLWFILVILAIPTCYVGYTLLVAQKGQDQPVVGVRYKYELDPEIDDSQFDVLQENLEGIERVEAVEINLKSSTLRISIDIQDDSTEKQTKAVLEEAYKQVDAIYPIDTYFTNTEGNKMYDMEIDAYTFIPDDEHSVDDQVYVKLVKSAAMSKPNYDYMSKAKDADLVKQIVRDTTDTDEDSDD
jgi:hypothetical protein